MEEKKTTESLRKAVKKYDSKFERINCRFAIGTKERIKALNYSSWIRSCYGRFRSRLFRILIIEAKQTAAEQHALPLFFFSVFMTLVGFAVFIN